jgi:2-oxoglutarate ferredoxin oxidoreductase subunit delta
MATGRIVIDAERCKGCELCRPSCPQSVIQLAESLNSKGYRPAFYADPDHLCTGCALCAVVCPDGCITVFRDLPQKSSSRQRQQEGQAYVEAIA